jgi:hypothetical protein
MVGRKQTLTHSQLEEISGKKERGIRSENERPPLPIYYLIHINSKKRKKNNLI